MVHARVHCAASAIISPLNPACLCVLKTKQNKTCLVAVSIPSAAPQPGAPQKVQVLGLFLCTDPPTEGETTYVQRRRQRVTRQREATQATRHSTAGVRDSMLSASPRPTRSAAAQPLHPPPGAPPALVRTLAAKIAAREDIPEVRRKRGGASTLM